MFLYLTTIPPCVHPMSIMMRNTHLHFFCLMLHKNNTLSYFSLISILNKDQIIDYYRKYLHVCFFHLQKFESSIEKLIKLGYKREVLPVMKDHALVLCNMARHSLEKEIIHTYYMQSMMVLKEGVSLAEEAFRDTLTLTSLQEVSHNRK